MEPREVHERRDELRILDVREPYEWRAGHIQGAVHIPMGELTRRQREIPLGVKVVCVCRSGARSASVADALARAGYDAENMEGGMKAWSRQGLPFVSAAGGQGRIA